MIIGLGVDVIEINRIEKALNNYPNKFISRIFTDTEQKTLQCYTKKKGFYLAAHIAGRFAGKEAIVKALGTGIGKISWKDIEITPNELGKPEVKLIGSASSYAKEINVTKIFISISHSKENAVAAAIASSCNYTSCV